MTIAIPREVGVKIGLLQRALAIHHIASAHVTSSAIGGEDLSTMISISSQSA